MILIVDPFLEQRDPSFRDCNLVIIGVYLSNNICSQPTLTGWSMVDLRNKIVDRVLVGGRRGK